MASPESLGLTLQEMRDLWRKGMGGLREEDVDNEEVDRFLNMAFWNIESRFPFKSKECITEWASQTGENGYLVPNLNDAFDLESIQSLAIIDDQKTIHPLERWHVWKWQEVYDHPQGATTRGLPEFYVRVDETIWVHPTPDKSTYTFRLYLLKSLKTLIAVGPDPILEPDIPRNWHEIVVEEAIVRGKFYMGEYNQAQQAANFPLSKTREQVMVRAKEELDSHYAGLDVLWDFPD